MSKPSIVLVGAGRFGMNHLRVLKELEEEGLCTFVGVVDTRLDVLKNVKKSCNVTASPQLNDFLTGNTDSIDIVTPTDTHFSICKECLNAGKHVFVEKPLTTSYVEAEELAQIAREQSKILMVGHIFRYNSAVQKIKEFIQKEELGEIYYLFGHFMGIKDPRLDIGALYNYTVHHIDTYNYLLEKLPQEVTCTAGHFLGRKKFEDVAIITLKYPSGTIAMTEGSWLPPGKCRDLTVVGSKKSVASDLLKQTLKLYNSRIEIHNGQLKAIDQGVTEINLEIKEPLRLELLDFIESINTGRKPLADGQSALNVIKVMEKALESARLGRTVSVS
jgi:UDP-N-acetylglucosamine 3-dehydrogenase